MPKNLHQLFKETDTAVAPSEFCEQVYVRIEHAAAKHVRDQKYLWGSFFIASLSAFIASCFYAFQTFAASSFGSYFSLIFSDTRSIGLVWKELGLSLIESLPIVGIGIFFVSMLAVLYCLRNFSKQTNHFFTSTITA